MERANFNIELKRSTDPDHALQRIIERLEANKVFQASDKEWGANYWRALLKRYIKNHGKTYEQLETLIGDHSLIASHGLLKQMQTLPKRYPRWGWLRNQLK
jgi:hypothetical protein